MTFEAYPFLVAGDHDAVAGSPRDGTPPPVDPGDAVAVLEVLEAARNTSS